MGGGTEAGIGTIDGGEKHRDVRIILTVIHRPVAFVTAMRTSCFEPIHEWPLHDTSRGRLVHRSAAMASARSRLMHRDSGVAEFRFAKGGVVNLVEGLLNLADQLVEERIARGLMNSVVQAIVCGSRQSSPAS